jgi:hypothetical protein
LEVTTLAKTKPEKAPMASPLSGNVPALSQETFQTRFDVWLRQHEAAKPFHALRELEARIRVGEGKLKAAEQKGASAADPGYRGAVEKLAGLKAERDELTKTAQIPFFAFNTVHNFLRASRGWNLPLGSRIEIRVPGIFDVAVDLAEIPF